MKHKRRSHKKYHKKRRGHRGRGAKLDFLKRIGKKVIDAALTSKLGREQEKR